MSKVRQWGRTPHQGHRLAVLGAGAGVPGILISVEGFLEAPAWGGRAPVPCTGSGGLGKVPPPASSRRQRRQPHRTRPWRPAWQKQQNHAPSGVLHTEGAAAPRAPPRLTSGGRRSRVNVATRGMKSASGPAVDGPLLTARPPLPPHLLCGCEVAPQEHRTPTSPTAPTRPSSLSGELAGSLPPASAFPGEAPGRPSLQTEPFPSTIPEKTRGRTRLASRLRTCLPAPNADCLDAAAAHGTKTAEKEDSSK